MNNPQTQFHFLGITGLTLYTVQRCERFLGHCLTYLLTRGKPVSIIDLSAMDETHRQATLGRLDRALRKDYDLPSKFDKRLQSFIADRNRFVHRLFHEPGFELEDDSACAKTLPFIESLFHEATFISATLQDCLVASFMASGRTVPKDLADDFQCLPASSVPLEKFLKPVAAKKTKAKRRR